MCRLVRLLLCLVAWGMSVTAHSECLRTDDPSTRTNPETGKPFKINAAALNDLAEIGVSEKFIWDDLARTSIPETQGCWAGASGNDDGQILSLGVQQWNFGQNSLQMLLRKFKALPGSDAAITQTMPTYGGRFFSDGCLRLSGPNQVAGSNTKISQACFNFISAHYTNGKPGFALDFLHEVESLFNSPLMRQVQLDEYVRNISAHKHDFTVYFPNDKPPSPIQVKWVIDITTQQGGLPPYSSVVAARQIFSRLSSTDKQADLIATAQWYEGACKFSDSEGVGHKHADCDYNAARLRAFATSGAWKTEDYKGVADLFLLTRIKSRIAQGKGGIYQAVSFERRIQIALGCGMVSGTPIKCPFYDGKKISTAPTATRLAHAP
ncbi:hypothetical protein Y033_665 [Burkholderia pseudomallei MSHR435]|nr:hypothetical protein BG17_1351 [Burkholderia pseudomallei MSHR491]KGW83143.1 hypothetical protein Y034_800 [Burkholderia pseudomallei MSHR449]KGX74212.1 hypothetical protein Y033_665 [Burkholderia pseudomallei MSHR435]